ncbi:MAG: hypothetical protein ACKOGO_03500 [Holophagaceae bacterium]
MKKICIFSSPTTKIKKSHALLGLFLILTTVACFRASGSPSPAATLTEIPVTGGDRIKGMKASAGPGDFFFQNDYLAISIDGAKFGQSLGQFHNPSRGMYAPSGGAILDFSSVKLDSSYSRYLPSDDMIERLGVVVNQDPELPLVFSSYVPSSTSDGLTLDMIGKLQDPTQKLIGVTRDSSNCVVNVSVSQQIKLGTKSRYLTVTTTITNNGTSTLPIRNISDFLHQGGGGYRIVAPAYGSFSTDSMGNPLTRVSNWGVNIPQSTELNGSNFSSPLMTSVRAPYVVFLGSEPSDGTLDQHSSIGILPVTDGQVLVTSDPQDSLGNPRPIFPSRVVVGGKEVSSLSPNTSIKYERRFYITSGSSGDPALLPSETTSIQNLLLSESHTLRGIDIGAVQFGTFGTSQRKGYAANEIRFERFTGQTTTTGTLLKSDNALLSDPSWKLERIDWLEGFDTSVDESGGGNLSLVYLPLVADPNIPGSMMPYRVVTKSAEHSSTMIRFSDASDATNPTSQRLLRPRSIYATVDNTPFILGELLAPERSLLVNSSGEVINSIVTPHAFSVKEIGTDLVAQYAPATIIFAGLDAFGQMQSSLDPWMKRTRTNGAFYDVMAKDIYLLSSTSGAYQFAAGNSVFGSAFQASNLSPFLGFFPTGSYSAIALRGPLSIPDVKNFSAYNGNALNSHDFAMAPLRMPSGWIAFDLPGPTQRTTGYMTPAEQLSSGLAQGLQVVGRTDIDYFIDDQSLYTNFRQQFLTPGIDASSRNPIGDFPFIVPSRTGSFSQASATGLFTPKVSAIQFGGAISSATWTLADFINQGGHSYTVVHRPRGPQGLFTTNGGINASVPLGSGVNSWWAATSSLSGGKKTGDFDAIELIRSQSFDPLNPSAWWGEFLVLRQDWFNLIGKQSPTKFTKALGLSSALVSLDTQVGSARSYLNIGSATLTQSDLSSVLTALQSGKIVASTGPLVIPSIGSVGPGGLVSTGAPIASVSLNLDIYCPDWIPLDQIRVVLNGTVITSISKSNLVRDVNDSRHFTATLIIPMSSVAVGKGAWLVVEAGVPLNISGVYAPNTVWSKYSKGLYPIAISNPIFINVSGSGYTPPLP